MRNDTPKSEVRNSKEEPESFVSVNVRRNTFRLAAQMIDENSPVNWGNKPPKGVSGALSGEVSGPVHPRCSIARPELFYIYSEFLHSRNAVFGQTLEESYIRADFGVETVALKCDHLAESVQGDVLAGIEFHLIDIGVADGGDVTVFVAEFEHDGSLAHTTQPTERAEVFGFELWVVWLSRVTGGVFGKDAVVHRNGEW